MWPCMRVDAAVSRIVCLSVPISSRGHGRGGGSWSWVMVVVVVVVVVVGRRVVGVVKFINYLIKALACLGALCSVEIVSH